MRNAFFQPSIWECRYVMDTDDPSGGGTAEQLAEAEPTIAICGSVTAVLDENLKRLMALARIYARQHNDAAAELATCPATNYADLEHRITSLRAQHDAVHGLFWAEVRNQYGWAEALIICAGWTVVQLDQKSLPHPVTIIIRAGDAGELDLPELLGGAPATVH